MQSPACIYLSVSTYLQTVGWPLVKLHCLVSVPIGVTYRCNMGVSAVLLLEGIFYRSEQQKSCVTSNVTYFSAFV